MIETMDCVTIVTSSASKAQMLEALRDAGIVHIRQLKASCERSTAIAARSQELMKAMNAISDEAGKAGRKTGQESLTEEGFATMHKAVAEAIDTRRKASEERLRISGEISRIAAWGDFDPDAVEQLAQEGIRLSFATLDERLLDELAKDEGVRYIRLGTIAGSAAIALVDSVLPASIPCRPFSLPEHPLGWYQNRLQDLDDEMAQCSRRIALAAKYLDCYRHELKKLEEDSMYERVKATSQDEEGGLCLLSGYMPHECCDDFRALAKSNGWAYLIREVEDEDNPPTKLRYKGLIRIIQPIYDILGTVPGYREYDISSWFLLFFSIFFAMIIGDAGYGLIFLIIAIVMNVKAHKCSDVNILLYVLSATTIIYGAVTGTWFGSLAVLEKLPFLQVFIIPSLCNYSMELYGIESVYAQNNVMQLCFILGATQLALARVLNIIQKAKAKDISLLGDLGWFLDVVVLYMMALYLVIGQSVNFTIVVAGIVVGFVLVIVFGSQSPGESFAKGLKAGVGGLFTSFLDTVSCFSNIMSYIRLFAVGMASLAIAQSFNNMAGMAGPVFGALIVVLGTVLNIVMGFLSVIVHGVRLNLLEFSGQLGMEWTGYKYEPFRKTVQTSEEIVKGDVK